MTHVDAAPAERAFREHLTTGRFRAGVAAGRWRLVAVDWPFAVIAVSAAPRPNGPAEFILRFELGGYPATAPTGGLWDLDANASLAAQYRPKGERVAQLFRTDWGSATAMYAPWDRTGLQSHPDWANQHQQDAWNPTRDLSFVLTKVYEVLNTDDYLGI